MTREEREDAIDYFKRSYASGNTDDERHHNEVLDTAIEALEQQPCEDCISRQATVRRLCKVADFMNEKREGLGSPYIMAALFIQDNKDEFPPVTPKERTGKWIYDEKSRVYRCSCCNRFPWRVKLEKNDEIFTDLTRTNAYKFCPNCGAKMVEPQENEDKG